MRNLSYTVLCLVCIVGAVQGQGEEKKPAIRPVGGDRVSINFSGTSLKEVVKVFEQYTGKRFLFDETVVSGKQIHLLSNKPIPVERIIDVFESILEIEGLTLIKTGQKGAEIFKIVEAKTVTGKATKTFTAEDIEGIPENDRVVTLVFQLKYIQADQLGQAFRRMTTVPNGLQPIPGSNLLIITDYATNVKRIGRILEALDEAGPKILRETIKLRNADPIELVREVQPLINIENRVYRAQIQRRMETRFRQILGRGARNRNLQGLTTMMTDTSSPIAVAAIPRLGSVIISATEEKIGDIKELITSLDIKDPDEKVIEYYTLRYQRPSSLSRTLSGIFGVAGGTRQAGRGQRGRRPARTGTLKNISIVADDESSKLIVVASRRTHEEVASVIERLDAVSDFDRQLEYYPVKFADLDEVGNIIAQVFQLETGTDNRIMKWVRRSQRRGIVAEKKGVYASQDMILVNKNLGSLLVITQKEVHEKIAKMVKQLDVQGPGEKSIVYYRLKFARAEDIASTLSYLFPTTRGAQRGRRRGGTGPTADRSISVVPNAKMETVIILASGEIHKEIQEVIKNLDVESSTLELRYHTVKHGDPAEIANVLGRLFKVEVGSGPARIQARRGRGRNQRGGAAQAEEPVIIPEANLSALVVLAERKTHESITTALKKLDVEGPGERIVEYYTLRYQKPSILTRTLSDIFGVAGARRGGRGQRGRGRAQAPSVQGVSIVGDDGSNKLVVMASKKMHEEVAAVIQRLDVLSEDERSLVYYPIRHVDPDAVGGTLSQVFQLETGDSNRLAQWMRRRSRRGADPGKTGVYSARDLILVDKNLSSLIVITRKEIHGKIAEMLKALDVEGPGEKRIAYYGLEFARAEEVAATLSSLFSTARMNQRARRRGADTGGQDRTISVVANEKMETVMVLAIREVHEEIKEIIKNLDVEGATLELKYYNVVHAELEETATTLGRLFKVEVGSGTTRLQARRGRGRNVRGAVLSEEPVIIPDANLGALLVLAERKTHEGVAAALKKLDVEGPGERITRFYKIKHTSVTEVASALTGIFEGARSGTVRRGGRRPSTQPKSTAVVIPNEELSTVVVSASRELHEEIATVVESLDVESLKDNVLRYYPIHNSELEQVADTVSKVFNLTKGDDRRLQTYRRQTRRRGQTQQRTPFSQENVVVADFNLGSLIIVAPLEVHEKIQPVLEKIDSVGPGKREVKYYRVARSSIREMAATIASIFDLALSDTRQSRRTRNPNLPLQTSVVIPNESLGCIIVVAPADIQKRIETVLKGMDKAGPDENELKYYKVEKSDLIEAANILSQIFGIAVGTVEQTFRQRGRRQTAELLTKERVIIPNENLNTLMVVAPNEMHMEIEETIKRIDDVGPRDHVFKMYEVTVSEVTTAAQTISQLFDIPVLDSRLRVTRPRRGATTGPKISADPFILPDEELGSLIVNAPEEIHVEIKKVLDKLVSIGQQEKMSIRFYKLKNTDAEEVSAKIGSLFNITVGTPGATRVTRRRTSRGGIASRRGRTSADEEEEKKPEVPQEAPAPLEAGKKTSKKEFYFEGESVVIPDKNLNSIILIAPDYIHTEVKAILDTLDVRRPQVLFEVAILDITSDDILDIGTEIDTVRTEGVTTTQGRGFTNFNIARRETSPNGGFPSKTTVPVDMAGLFVGVTKGDVNSIPILVRLLQQNTDVIIRSTPLLLVNDNEDAVFSSLSEQPTTSTSQGTATTNISFGGFVEAGTTLKITPHVSEGNYIRVDIDLKVENFYGEAPGPGIPPAKASNQLTTSITVPDSRTVVIGGLTTRKRTQIKKGIPLLCDIPLLGYLFSSTSDQDETSRLFLFIKPQILSDVDFKDLNEISKGKSREVHGITGEKIVPDEKVPGEVPENEAAEKPVQKPVDKKEVS